MVNIKIEIRLDQLADIRYRFSFTTIVVPEKHNVKWRFKLIKRSDFRFENKKRSQLRRCARTGRGVFCF